MRVLGLVVVVGLVGRVLVQRRWPALGQLRGTPVLVAAILVQVVGGALCRGALRPVPVLACYAVVLGWIVVNLGGADRRTRAGLAICGAGVALNLVPIAAYGGMPVSLRGLRQIGERTGVPAGHLYRHVAAAHGHLLWLSDIVALPAMRAVVSPGDLTMVPGLILLLAVAPSPAVRATTAPVAAVA